MYHNQDLFDLSHTLAGELFLTVEYPWQVLPQIGDFIKKLGPQLLARGV